MTTDALEALLYIYNSNEINGYETTRWNFPDAVGTSRFDPGGIGNAASLTYSFLASNPAWSVETGFEGFDTAMTAATNSVLTSISRIANIDFTPVAAQQGQMTFGMSPQVGSSAYAYMPNYGMGWNDADNITSVTEDRLAGSVWVNFNEPWIAADWKPGNFGYYVLLHEVGHALGLKHPFENDGSGGGFVLARAIDNEAHTVMSYTEAPRTLLVSESGTGWLSSYLSPSTMMMMDIEALQHLYGANMATRAGNTPYSFETNEELLETIWDGGGVDTLDCSNQIFTCRINLRDGAFSSIGLRRNDAEIRLGLDLSSSFNLDMVDPGRTDLYNGQNNLGIAKGAIIEHATGGSGDDVIIGNDVANRLLGGGGRDNLSGGGGADRMDGGAGKDVFDFNRLNDTASTIASADVIIGFVPGADRIDLSTLDANSALADNQMFTFIGVADFDANASGQVRFEGGVLYGSTDADGVAEFVIKVSGVAALTAADFIL